MIQNIPFMSFYGTCYRLMKFQGLIGRPIDLTNFNIIYGHIHKRSFFTKRLLCTRTISD